MREFRVVFVVYFYVVVLIGFLLIYMVIGFFLYYNFVGGDIFTKKRKKLLTSRYEMVV